jgi:hypothetical protein
MSLIATLALAVSAGSTLPQCSWDRPGANPFMGDVVTAVDHYQDIPAATREKLKARMKARRYDDIALIERDSIKGKADYAPEIRDMHFGPGAICRTVTRTKWTPTTKERGLVYCEDGQCILVPTVCRNVSRIRREERPVAMAPAQTGPAAAPQGDNMGPLEFDPPAAGPMAAPAAPDSFAQQAGTPSLASPVSNGLLAGNGGAPVGGGGSTPGPIDIGTPALPPGRVPTGGGLPTDGGGVPAIPEPHSWAMIAVGLLVVGFCARRRQQN